MEDGVWRMEAATMSDELCCKFSALARLSSAIDFSAMLSKSLGPTKLGLGFLRREYKRPILSATGLTAACNHPYRE
jgi:hypothetical protein